ncbi:MAG: hypothetical protein R2836_05320 [Chitinophagales bacterium]|nr:hypothetical protein [Bacteroidota bacterium]MCB9226769.1 hypothetical protein [Chitinophagales bacterium]
MKQFKLTLVLLSIIFYSYSQGDFKAGAEKMKSLVEAENYREAMQYGDKLIGEGVKEGYEKYAGQVYLYRGIAKFNFEIFDDAIVDLKQGVAFNKTLTEAYYYIAEIYYDLSSYSMALENVIYFLEQHPDDTKGLALKSRCLLELGEPMAAKIIIQKAIALVSSDPELYYVRASVNRALGEDDKACKDAKISYKFGYEDAKGLVDSYCGNSEDGTKTQK